MTTERTIHWAEEGEPPNIIMPVGTVFEAAIDGQGKGNRKSLARYLGDTLTALLKCTADERDGRPSLAGIWVDRSPGTAGVRPGSTGLRFTAADGYVLAVVDVPALQPFSDNADAVFSNGGGFLLSRATVKAIAKALSMKGAEQRILSFTMQEGRIQVAHIGRPLPPSEQPGSKVSDYRTLVKHEHEMTREFAAAAFDSNLIIKVAGVFAALPHGTSYRAVSASSFDYEAKGHMVIRQMTQASPMIIESPHSDDTKGWRGYALVMPMHLPSAGLP